MSANIKDVAAVVCTFNSEANIGKVLASLKDNFIEEIIVVDAASEDKSVEIARQYTNLIFQDPREGLAKARNIGITEVTKKYTLNVGSDNIMPEGSIFSMLDYMIKNNYSGVSAQTLLKSDKITYLSFAMNIYKQLRYYPGERNVIGTPSLFETKLLKENPFDNKMSWSDDGDLCTRLRAEGHRFAIADSTVYEIGSESISSIIIRWKGYGKSDWETYSKYSVNWSFSRKLQSILHPLKNELFLPMIKARLVDKIRIFPFLLFITFLRYSSWIRWSITSKHND